MMRLSVIVLALLFALACGCQGGKGLSAGKDGGTAGKKGGAVITFVETSHDMGDVTSDQDEAIFVFPFKNTGTETLSIDNVKGG